MKIKNHDKKALREEQIKLKKELLDLQKERDQINIDIKNSTTLDALPDDMEEAIDLTDFEISDKAIIQYLILRNRPLLDNTIRQIKNLGLVAATTEGNVVTSINGLSKKGHISKRQSQIAKMKNDFKPKKQQIGKKIQKIHEELGRINSKHSKLQNIKILKTVKKAKIRKYIKHNNLTQKQYAQLIGVSPSTVSRWIKKNQQVKIKITHLVKINALKQKHVKQIRKTSPKGDPAHPLIKELKQTKKKLRNIHARIQQSTQQFDINSIKNLPESKILIKLIQRDGAFCHYCNTPIFINKYSPEKSTSPENLSEAPDCATIDHVVPKVLGGKNAMYNYVVACRSCNIKKDNKLYGHFIRELVEEKEKCQSNEKPDWLIFMGKNYEKQSKEAQ